jgi:hypothetical protein
MYCNFREYQKLGHKSLIFKRSKIAPLCISIETVEVAFFVTGLETLQMLGIEMSTGGSTKSNVNSRFIYQ